MAEETINGIERVYDGMLVKVDRYDITLPNGKPAQREVVQHPGSVGIIAFDSDGQVVLVRQYRLPAGLLRAAHRPDV
jgi:ADP-ribose pyrophosphatase